MIQESSPLKAAAELMRLFGVATLLVTRDPPRTSEAVGVISDRDLVLTAMVRGDLLRTVRVCDAMTSGLPSVRLGTDLHDAFEIMRCKGLRRLLVTRTAPDDKQIAGFLCIDDVVDALASALPMRAAKY